MAKYNDSAELKKLGEQLIQSYHLDLTSVKIGYLFREKASVSRGVAVLGMTMRVDDRNYVFSGRDVIIEIAADVWQMLNDAQKEAALDHELCHIGVELDDQGRAVLTENGRIKIAIKAHDFEAFASIMERDGASVKAIRDLCTSIGVSP